MAVIYICDKCKKEFKQPLDRVVFEDGVLDLCAKCRNSIEESVREYRRSKLKSILNKKK